MCRNQFPRRVSQSRCWPGLKADRVRLALSIAGRSETTDSTLNGTHILLVLLVEFFDKMFRQPTLSKSSPPRRVSGDGLDLKDPVLDSQNGDVNLELEPFFLSSPNAIAAAVGSLIIWSTFKPAMIPASSVAWHWKSLKKAGTVTTASLTVLPR